jgi:hypothetical protein|tara:strand:+ start:938 stop:1849 length:912 start_codon:yes stop_codon:yes gene_type:complete
MDLFANFWFLLPLISSFIVAALTIIVQNNKQIPPVLIFAGKSLFLSLMLFPVLPFINIPTEPIFFIAILIIAACNSIGGTIVYSANHKYGGGLTTRILPLTTIITIFAFFVVFPDTATKLFDAGSMGFLFIASIFIMCASIYFMSKAETSFQAVMYILPSCFLYAFSNVIQKLMIDQTELVGGIIAFLCFANLAQGIICLAFSELKNKRKKVAKATFKFKKRYLIPLIGVALCSLGSAVLGLVAVKMMANPGIALLIARAAPIWVYIYNVKTGEEKLDGKVIPSFVFLAFATITILLYNIIIK